MQQPEFLKSLIALLAQSGGQITLPMRELQQLGLQVTLSDIFSDNAASLTLRLAAKIYYVPAVQPQPTPPEEIPWQTTPAPASINPASAPSTTSPPELQSQHRPEPPSHPPSTQRQSQPAEEPPSHEPPERELLSVEDQIAAVNNLNNRPPLRPRPVRRKKSRPREAVPPLPAGQNTPGQPAPTQQPPSSPALPPQPEEVEAVMLPSSGPARSIRKDDLSLFLREQAILTQQSHREDQARIRLRQSSREFPWETRTNGKPPPATPATVA